MLFSHCREANTSQVTTAVSAGLSRQGLRIGVVGAVVALLAAVATPATAAAVAPVDFEPAPASPFAAGDEPASVAAADVNGDGNPDLATANFRSNDVSVLLGDGDGGFTAAAASPFPVGGQPFSVAVADVNGDGNPDLATANRFSNDVSVLLGDGDGGFTAAAASPFPAGDNPSSVAAADVNGDGNPDLATANFRSNDVSVLLGDGDGGFTAAAASPFAAGDRPFSVAVADVNGDGNPDLATANVGEELTDEVSVLLGDGDGGFTLKEAFETRGDRPFSVTAVDVNGDGNPDLVTANPDSNDVSVLLGDGDGEFTLAEDSPFAAGDEPWSVAAVDVNGDGNPDLATANRFSNDVSVLLGGGDGGFTAASASPFPAAAAADSPSSVAAADVNGDNRPDLATANAGSEDVSVLLQQPVDTDGDGLNDQDEVNRHGTDRTDPDTDDDGLDDGAEVNSHGTDPTAADTDRDGLEDGAEVNRHGTDPTAADTDRDGLEDGAEVNSHGTDPTDPDTDGDGTRDGEEVAQGTDPTDPDSGGDSDEAGLLGLVEELLGGGGGLL